MIRYLRTYALLLALALLFTVSAFARGKYQGVASRSGAVITSSTSSSNRSLVTFPNCTVTIFLPGTTTLATIYSDEAGTPKANPFTANSDASFSFYADVAKVDIRFSGIGVDTPFTQGNVVIVDYAAATNAGISALSVAPASATNPIAVGDNDPRVNAEYFAQTFSNFTNALSVCAVTDATLVIDTTVTKLSTATIPATCHLRFTKTGKISSTFAYTMLGSLDAPPRQIFSGSGAVTFASNAKIQVVYPEWWGAVADGATDSTAAINAALAAMNAGTTLRIPAGITISSGNHTINKVIWVEGAGRSSVMRFKSGTSTSVPMFILSPPVGGGETYALNKQNWKYGFSNFAIDAEVPLQGGDGIKILNTTSGASAYQTEISRMFIYPVGGRDINLVNDNGGGGPKDVNGNIHLLIKDNVFANGVKMLYASDSLKIINNLFSATNAVKDSKKALELTFLSGAGNVTISENSVTMLGGVVLHNCSISR